MWGRVIVILGRALRSVRSPKFLTGVGTRFRGLFSATRVSNASRGSQIIRSSFKKVSGVANAAQTRFKSSMVGRVYYRLPKGVQSFIGATTSWLSADAAIDWIWGDDESGDGLVTDADGNMITPDAYAAAIAQRNGHWRLHAISAYETNNSASTSVTENHAAIVEDLMVQSNVVLFGTPSDSTSRDLAILTDTERINILARLATISKIVAHSSEYPNVMELFAHQAMASDNTNAAPTQGLADLLSSGGSVMSDADDKAAALCSVHNALYDEYSNAAAEDFFEDNTAVFSDKTLDVGDIKGRTTFRVAKLATDDVIGFNQSWWKKWLTDNDGLDDEGQMLKIINQDSVVSDNYVDFVAASVKSSESITKFI